MQRLFSRRWIVGGVLVWLGGCRAAMSGSGPGARSDRFKGVGLVLVTDAVPGAEMLGVEFYADDSTRRFLPRLFLGRVIAASWPTQEEGCQSR